MSANEYATRLAKTNDEIKHVTSELDRVKASKAEALLQGKLVEGLNHQLHGTQQRLEDLIFAKAALEGKLRIYQQNESEAGGIRERIAAARSELVDVAAGMATGVQQARKTLTDGLTKSGTLEAEINSLAAKHMQLVGEALHIPDWTLTARAYRDALDRLTADKFLETPLSPWSYVSEAERLEAREKQRSKEAKVQEARVKIAIQNAPICKVCEKPMTLRRNVGNDGETGLRGSGEWSYEHCFKVATKKVPETVLGSK